jgi:hypothetical protein
VSSEGRTPSAHPHTRVRSVRGPEWCCEGCSTAQKQYVEWPCAGFLLRFWAILGSVVPDES